MSKREPSRERPQRRSRGEIDRNYFFGDVFIKSGVALAVALGLIGFFTPFSLGDAVADGMFEYLAVMGSFAVIAFGLLLAGRHLRREATHWDFD